jgi:hypothetical protein
MALPGNHIAQFFAVLSASQVALHAELCPSAATSVCIQYALIPPLALVAAVFQDFPGEAWGVNAARDTAWMPGSLAKMAGHMWNASRDNSIEVALMNW